MDDRRRAKLTQEMARIMVEESSDDFALARKKAVDRLGLKGSRNLPRDEEILTATIEYLRIFSPPARAIHLRHLRQLALEAMKFFANFEPLIVGGVWFGTAGMSSAIKLQLYAETAEEVMLKLLDGGIPYRETSHFLPRDDSSNEEKPAFSFLVENVEVKLLFFPSDQKFKANRKIGSFNLGGKIGDLEKLIALDMNHAASLPTDAF